MQTDLIFILGFVGRLIVLAGTFLIARLFATRSDLAFLAAVRPQIDDRSDWIPVRYLTSGFPDEATLKAICE